MSKNLFYLKEQLPSCKMGVLKSEAVNKERLDHCIVAFSNWKNADTITCTTNLEDGEADVDQFTSGNTPVTIKFINRKKNLYVVITGRLIIYRKNFLLRSVKVMAEILVEGADFFTMKNHGKSIRLLEPLLLNSNR